MFLAMDTAAQIALVSGAVTAFIIAIRTVWNLFVQGVRAAIHDEMAKFHRELTSVDEFWSEKIGKLESSFDELSKRVEELSARIP